MKKILLFIAIIGALIIIVLFTKQAKEVEVNDRLITKMASGLDLDSYSIFSPRKYAMIQGEVLNKSDKTLSGVNLVYLIGNDTLIVIIEYLGAEDKAFFSTKEFEVSTGSTDYTLLEVNFSD
ncbi:MAG: hypothetical protein ACW990_09365 [Promethearchaeota archaeon]